MALSVSLSRDSYTLPQLASDVVQCTTEALRTRSYRARRAGHPHPLPIATRLPGGGEIFLRRDVEEWLLSLRATGAEVRRRGRGRPRKNESALRAVAGVSE